MRRIGVCVTLAGLLALSVGSAAAQSFNYQDFSSNAGLTLNGFATAPFLSGGRDVLRLTDTGSLEAGSAWHAVTLPSDGSFSTAFAFVIAPPNGADGMTFALQAAGATALGNFGGDLGYGTITPSLAVEFDTYDNAPADPNGNHVGIDLNGDVASVLTALPPGTLADGESWFAWIDYDGSTDSLEVRLSRSTTRPTNALLTYSIDVPTQLGTTTAWVGFTGGTGGSTDDHDVLQWSFTTGYAPQQIDVSVPALGPFGLALLAFLLAAVVIILGRRMA
jgi:Legume lectin domain